MSPPTHRADALATPLLAPLRAARAALLRALDNSVVLLAALLLTNGLRVYYRSWLTDALFGVVLALLGWALLRDRDARQDAERQPAPPSPDQRAAPPAASLTEPHATKPAARDAWAHTLWTSLLHGAPRAGHRAAHRWARLGAKLKAWSSQLASWRGGWPWRRTMAVRRRRRLILTPLGFLALIAVYGFGLFQEFTDQGFRNLAAIACAAAVFLFCYARGPELARSKATVPLVVAALVALLPSYFTDVVIHAHMFAAMLGYALLTAGILLAARARSTRAQALLAHGALFLALVCGLIYGSRAQVLVTVLAYGFYWASQGLLKSRFGSLGLAGCAGVVVGIVVLWYASPRSDETMRRLDAWSLSYTGAVLNTGRENLFRATLAGIAESPWWGHGPGVDITDFPAKAPAELPADVAPDDPLCMSGSPPELLRDCRTLLRLRNTLAGEAPQALWHWNFNFPLSRWSGVSIAGDPPRIVGIQLVNAKLTGQLPAALAELDQLETLALDTNYLNGAIPPELGALTQLKTLSLSNNALSGEVPATLTKLSELRTLDLSNNQLQGPVPAILAEVTGLEELKLAGNAFAGPLPAALYGINQHDLYEGLLCRDALREHYPGLFEDCSALLAGRDVLAGDGALNWSRVAPINAWRGVQLAGTPPRVRTLSLSDAGLNGRIPKELGALRMLEFLKLDGNRLSGGVPWALQRLDHLQEVRLGGNDLTETPPAPLFRVPFNDLRNMLYCAHTGTIGDGLLRDCETLLGVKDMLAGEGQLNWRRGKPLGEWRGVQLGGEPLRIVGLTLGNSDLNGRVPPALANLDELTMLYLDDNDLSGTLPAELGQLAHLRTIKLDDTLLTRGVPTALCGLESLAGAKACASRPPETNPGLRADQDALLAAREHLDPDEVLNWHPDLAFETWDGIVLLGDPLRVTAVLLSGRGLAGEVSPAFARLDELVELWLPRNRLRGAIPPQLGQLTRLESLNLAGNALSGAIPRQLGNLQQLLALSLEGNRLTGPVPNEIAALPQLAFLRLAGNDFTGNVPADLRNVPDHDIDQELFCFPSPHGNSAQLEDCLTLLAARDELAGDGQLNWRTSTPIGQWQGVILGAAPTRVVALDLAKLGLTGRIPAALGRLTALRSLVLDGNALTGPIPTAVRHLKGLRTLRVEGNALNRDLPVAWSSQATPTAVGVAPPGADGSGDGAAACSLAGPNSGLVADCRTLLAARDTLAGGASLNWSGMLPIEAWDGLALGGAPRRVVALNLAGVGLTGRIPAALGQLSRLVTLRLNDNRLRGSVPAALGRLANLEVLWLNNNALHGTLPPALGELPRLRVVRVAGNEFSGRLPASLRELDHDLDEALFCLPLMGIGPGLLQDCNALLVARDTLAGSGALNWRREVALGVWQGVELGGEPPRVVGLDVAELGLNGQIPAELGGLTELRRLALGGNALTGPVPDELVRLSQLETLWLFRQPSGTDAGGAVSKRTAVPRFPTVGTDAHVSRQPPPCTTDNPALAADCELLLEIRRTLGARLNWSRTLPVENWEGVKVGGTPRRVTGVFLGNRGLTGRVPSAIGQLDKLERLSLHGNGFSGPLPPSIWRLSNLTYLNVTNNQLTGAIPDELPQMLERVVLGRNRFTGRIPPALLNLPKLKEVKLDNNAFTDCAVPPHKPDLRIKLPVDSFHCLPLPNWKAGLKRDAAILLAARDELAGDGELDWSRTKSIAAWQGVTLAPEEHQGIVAIDLQRTGLTGRIPTQFSGLPLLETLRLDGNQLTGPIPEELALLPNLRELSLANNELSGMVSPSLRMRLASGMSTADNQLTGSAAAEPPATGSVPPALATAADTTRRADRSNAADRVATTVDAQGRSESAAADPQRSDLQDNTFATPFPAALRNIADHDLPPVCPIIPRANSGLLRDCLNLLDSRDALAGTATLNWSGTIPMAAWQGIDLGGSPIRVIAVELPDAGLNGRLPAALGNLDKLTKLRLENNRLAGPLPTQLGNLKRLQDLALSDNRLTGGVPAALGTLPRLEHLTLGGNRFSSPAPPALRAVERHDLDLEVFCPASRRQAPGLFEDCQTLLSVRDPLAGRASLNWRRGAPLGAWVGVRLGGDPLRVEALQLPGQGLDGRVPPELGRLSALRRLDLGGNALRGDLPAALARLTRLVELRLSNNRLSGIIPVELTALNLRLLRLAGNAFSGPVPVGLRHLPNTDLTRDLHCPMVPPSNPRLSDDCGELLALRDDLAPNGQLNWSLQLPVDRWQGVVLGGTPLRVVGLHLPRQGLAGRLPAALRNLSRLAAIDLSFNDLHGGIPPELGQLSRLRFVELRQNRLTGSIPGELGQLARLEELFLSGNQLTGHIPAALAQLSELVTLRLQGNRFLDCSAPARLATAAIDHDLEAALLCHPLEPRHPGLARDAATLLAVRDTLAGPGTLNWRKGTPMPAWEGVTLSHGMRPRVAGLELSAKSLTGRIPAALGDLDELSTLHLDANALAGAVPPELGRLKRLESLKLNDNLLTGTLPQTLGGLNALKVLRLSNNLFKGLPPTALRQVQDHDLGFGPRCGYDMADTPGLERDCGVLLAVRDNLAGATTLNWSPDAPIDMWHGVVLGGEPSRVIALHLIDSGLSGSIPPRLGELDALRSLRLSRNALSGTLPATLGKLSNLSELLLGDNALSGPIPRALGRLTNLTSLRLRKNRLDDPIPTELGRLHNLRELALDDNALSGPIPHELGELSALEALWLAGNDLTAPPSAIEASPSPAVRDPARAPRTQVPPALAAADAPQTFAASRAIAPGQPPPLGLDLFCTRDGAGTPELRRDCRSLLSALEDLSDPTLLNWHPEVPIGQWRGVGLTATPAPRVTSVDVAGMGLHGTISRQFTALSALEALRLNDNEFFGRIPGRIGRLKALRELRLERNELTGSIPLSIENLQELTELRLNDNALTGHLLPLKTLGKLSTMRLAGNNFLGCVPEHLRGIGDRLLELDLECGPTPWSQPPLFADAAALMASRDALAGGASLDWSYDKPVKDWQGVTVDGSPPRVVALDLEGAGLSGRVAAELGALSALTRLDLNGNALTGSLPPELGRLAHLRTLSVAANKLAGELPPTLDHLYHLAQLELAGNDFLGCPPELVRHRVRSALLPLTLRHCPTTWEYQTTERIGGTLNSINNLVDRGAEQHLAEGAHNLFLQMGLQTGLVGVGALGLLCMSLIFNLRSRPGRRVTPVQCLAAAGTAMAITHSAFDIFLLQYVMTVAVFVWMFLGIGTGLAHKQPEGDAEQHGKP